MDPVAAGFWGAFFGTAALLLAISLGVFMRSHRRVALTNALAALVSAAYVVAYLGWLPVQGEAEARLLAHVGVLAAVSLAFMLLALLGLLRKPRVWRQATLGIVVPGAAVLAAGWMLPAVQAYLFASGFVVVLALIMLAVALRSARRGDRLAWVTVTSMTAVVVAVTGLGAIALDRGMGWPVHAISALASILYLSVMGWAAWSRYAYLLELAEVMAHGPSYDPVTRMRSHSETGQMIGELFFHRQAEARTVGVIAICIANLYALENLHGRAAFNHALFVCAGRLRRVVPATVEMGRLGEDGFLLLARQGDDLPWLQDLARQLRERLARPIAVSTSRDPGRMEGAGTSWMPEVGIGVLATSTQTRPSQAVGTARAMARTAWSFPSRLACYDLGSGQIAELPLRDDPAAAAA